jgi:hypothetical protein
MSPTSDKLTLHTLAVDSYVPMLESLSAILDKAAAHAVGESLDLVNARLAPDMYPLAKQVNLACYYATDGTARLAGGPAREVTESKAQTLEDLKRLIAITVSELKKTDPTACAGAERRDCSISIPNGMTIEMNGLQFLQSWALPHFYFHVVTAYDILRHNGVVIGKQDYLSQVGRFIRPRP